MNKRIYIILFLLSICSVIVLAILFRYSNRASGDNNGFERVFLDKTVSLVHEIKLGKDFYSMADCEPNAIGIYKNGDPFNIVYFNSKLLTNKGLSFAPGFDKLKKKGPTSVTLIGKTAFILVGRSATGTRVSTNRRATEVRLDSIPFYQSATIDSNNFLFVSTGKQQGKNIRIVKKVNWGGEMVSHYIPEQQKEGIFSTDGIFDYDRKTKLLVYSFFYRGLLVCLDSNLKILYKAKTIDTIKNANISLKPITKGANKRPTGTTFSTPAKIVNRRIYIADDKIYVHSYIKADNEKLEKFEKGDVIDIYSLTNGKYSASFYLPKIRGEKLAEFKIYNNKIFALYNHQIAIFNIR